MNDNKFFAIMAISGVIIFITMFFFFALNEKTSANKEVKIACIESNKTYMKMFLESEHVGVEYCGNLQDFSQILKQYQEIGK